MFVRRLLQVNINLNVVKKGTKIVFGLGLRLQNLIPFIVALDHTPTLALFSSFTH